MSLFGTPRVQLKRANPRTRPNYFLAPVTSSSFLLSPVYPTTKPSRNSPTSRPCFAQISAEFERGEFSLDGFF